MPATLPEASVLVALGLWHVCRCVSARILVSLLLLPTAAACGNSTALPWHLCCLR
jgi:hypothetical protein